MFRMGIRVPLNSAESLAGGIELDLITEPFHPIPLPGIDITFHELDDTDFHVVPHRPQHHSHGTGRLAFAVAGQNHDQAMLFFRCQFGNFHSLPQRLLEI